MRSLDETVHRSLKELLMDLENHFKADVAFYYGLIDLAILKNFRDFAPAVSCCENSPPFRRTSFGSSRNRHP